MKAVGRAAFDMIGEVRARSGKFEDHGRQGQA